MTAKYDPRYLMSAYNYAKHYGKRTGLFDTRRVDRALGYLQSGELVEKAVEYGTTFTQCGCPDSQYRHVTCKHSIALMISRKYEQLVDRDQREALEILVPYASEVEA